MKRNVDDRIAWMAVKGGNFLVKSFYFKMFQGRLEGGCYLEFMGSKKSKFFCLGSNLERDLTYGQYEEVRLEFGE